MIQQSQDSIALPGETPWWFTPESSEVVIWADTDDTARHAAFSEQITSGASHLICEVKLSQAGQPQPTTAEGIQDLIQEGIDERVRLRNHGIDSAPTEWRIMRHPKTGIFCALARTAVIDGPAVTSTAFPNTYPQLGATFERASRRSRLAVELRHCIFGSQRQPSSGLLAPRRMYMVSPHVRLKPAGNRS